MPRPDLHLIAGLPYAGKSTLAARLLAQAPEAFIFAVDPLLHARAEAEGLSYHAAWERHYEAAERLMRTRLTGAIKARRTVIWDQLNLTRKTRTKLLNRFPAAYRRHCHYVLCSDEGEIERRRAARPEQPIPASVYAAMRTSFQPPAMSEGFDIFELIDTAPG